MPLPQWQLEVQPWNPVEHIFGAKVRKNLAEWGLNNVRATFLNADTDSLTFDAPGRPLNQPALFNPGDLVRLFHPDGRQWFYGEIIQPTRDFSARRDVETYVAEGPWGWLHRRMFMITWRFYVNGVPAETAYPQVVFNMRNGVLINAGQQIREIIEYAIARGDDIQIGTITSGVQPPVSEERNVLCSSAIRRQLALAVNNITWFDYSTDKPRFNSIPANTLPVVTLTIGDVQGSRVSAGNIAERLDLSVSEVIIMYQRVGSISGRPVIQNIPDVYPPGRNGTSRDALAATVVLSGEQQVIQTGHTECDAILETTREWWRTLAPALADPRVVITDGPKDISRNGSTDYRNRLAAGAIAPWMDFHTERQRIACRMSYKIVDPGGNVNLPMAEIRDELITVDLVATDAPEGFRNWSRVFTEETGDPVPIGLAQHMYSALNAPQWQGAVTLVEAECSGKLRVGQRLNLLGSAEEHATMRGVVQRVVEHIDTGETQVEFGPPEHLSIQDLVNLLSVFNRHRRFTPPNTEQTGELGEGSTVELPTMAANDNSHRGQNDVRQMVVRDIVPPAAGERPGGTIRMNAPQRYVSVEVPDRGRIVLSLEGLPEKAGGAPYEMIPRETIVCDANGGKKRCWILRTEDEPLPP